MICKLCERHFYFSFIDHQINFPSAVHTIPGRMSDQVQTYPKKRIYMNLTLKTEKQEMNYLISHAYGMYCGIAFDFILSKSAICCPIR